MQCTGTRRVGLMHRVGSGVDEEAKTYLDCENHWHRTALYAGEKREKKLTKLVPVHRVGIEVTSGLQMTRQQGKLPS